jgi:hypothetical protein
LRVDETAGSSSARTTTALLTETMLDSLISIVTLTVAFAIDSAVRFVSAAVRPVMVVSKMLSGSSESLEADLIESVTEGASGGRADKDERVNTRLAVGEVNRKVGRLLERHRLLNARFVQRREEMSRDRT